MSNGFDLNIAVSIGGLIFALVCSLAALAMGYGKLHEKVDQMAVRFVAEKEAAMAQHCRDVEELNIAIVADKKHNDDRIRELYESRNSAREEVVGIKKDVENMTGILQTLSDDIKDFMKEVRNHNRGAI